MVRLLFFVISSLCLLQSSLGVVVDDQSNGDDNKHSIRFRRSRSVMPPEAQTGAVTMAPISALPPISAPIATPVHTGPSVRYSLFN